MGAYLLLSFVGSLIVLDRTQAFQFMVSRPIVVATALGLVTGDPIPAVAIGIAFEFLYAGRLPVGAHVPPCDTLGALGAAGLLFLLPEYNTLAYAALATAAALPLAEWGRGVEIWLRKVNSRLALRVEDKLARGNWKAVEAAPWMAMLLAVLANGISLLLFFLGAAALLHAASPLPGWFESALPLFLMGLPLLGFAESMAAVDIRRYPRQAVLGLVIGIVILVMVA